jgi:hypothetical protein
VTSAARFGLALATVGALVEPAAAAPLSSELRVERAGDAEGCPDRAALARLVAGIVGATPSDGAAAVRADVSFARAPSGFEATLRLMGAREGERTLTDTGPTCTALGRAVAITLALLLDPELDARPPPPPPAPPVVVAPAVAVAPAPAPRPSSGFFGVVMGPALGLVGPATVDGGLGLSVEWRRHTFVQLEARHAVARATAFDTGSVDVSLSSARLRLCGLTRREAVVRAGLCVSGIAGVLRGEGHGFAAGDGAASIPWAGGGGGAQVTATLGGRWLIGLGADLLRPVRKSTFSIENRGVAFASSRDAATFQATLEVKLW